MQNKIMNIFSIAMLFGFIFAGNFQLKSAEGGHKILTFIPQELDTKTTKVLMTKIKEIIEKWQLTWEVFCKKSLINPERSHLINQARLNEGASRRD